MFQLKNKETLFGINKEASDHGTPVFEKELGDGIEAEANRDGTIFVQKGFNIHDLSQLKVTRQKMIIGEKYVIRIVEVNLRHNNITIPNIVLVSQYSEFCSCFIWRI